ncbi:MAG: ABC transporter permease, partial [Hyphomicrobiales bacterium]|nr:ABC transporter permease [Hyphomicrobiales bacterium]
GQKYVKVSGDLPAMSDKVMPLLDAAAKDYAEKNSGWPKRSEACDKAS